MPKTTTDPASDLRRAIERLPLKTRSAMLEAVRSPDVRLITGAFVTQGGGVCPLLAAHRRGGRANGASASMSRFADAWDDYTGTPTGRPRPAAPAERRALEGLLAASVARERRRQREAELARAAAERRTHERERRTRAALAQIQGGWLATRLVGGLGARSDRDRGPELERRPGWAWLGIHRRYDEYRAALSKALRSASGARSAGVVRPEREAELVA